VKNLRKMNKSLLLIFILVLSTFFSLDANAQKRKRGYFYGPSNINLLRTKISRHAIIFSLGATNMFSFDQRRARVIDGVANQEYFLESGGSFGAMVELGMLHFTKRTQWGFLKIDHFDWSLGFKNYRGWENTLLVVRDPNTQSAEGFNGSGNFDLGYVTARFTFHNVIKIVDRVKLDQGLGVNLDYKASGSNRFDISNYQPIVLPSTLQSFQKDFIAQIHYELGFRIRAVEHLHITPTFQIPLISAYQWSGGRSSIAWFSSRYQPWLVKVKIMLPRLEKQGKCPPVYSNPEDENRNKEYMDGK